MNFNDFQAEIPDEPEHPDDPRLTWSGMPSKESVYRAWPCGYRHSNGVLCSTRRDEHADQIEGRFPELDITDHDFVMRTPEEALAE